MLKFGHLRFHVDNFFRRYQSWVQYKTLNGKHQPEAVISDLDDDAIRVYMPWELELIESDERPVVAIDLREGLREIAILNERLTKNKHYIIFCGSFPGSKNRKIEFNHTLIFHEFILASMYELHLNPQSPFFIHLGCIILLNLSLCSLCILHLYQGIIDLCLPNGCRNYQIEIGSTG